MIQVAVRPCPGPGRPVRSPGYRPGLPGQGAHVRDGPVPAGQLELAVQLVPAGSLVKLIALEVVAELKLLPVVELVPLVLFVVAAAESLDPTE